MTRDRVERILRACVAERERSPGRVPGQTERLCRALLQAWDERDGIPRPTAKDGQHTPGPWEAVLENDPRGQPVCYYRAIIGLMAMTGSGLKDGYLSVIASNERLVKRDELEPNAKLIAAAPDLYSAVMQWLIADDAEDEAGYQAALSAARHAIGRVAR